MQKRRGCASRRRQAVQSGAEAATKPEANLGGKLYWASTSPGADLRRKPAVSNQVAARVSCQCKSEAVPARVEECVELAQENVPKNPKVDAGPHYAQVAIGTLCDQQIRLCQYEVPPTNAEHEGRPILVARNRGEAIGIGGSVPCLSKALDLIFRAAGKRKRRIDIGQRRSGEAPAVADPNGIQVHAPRRPVPRCEVDEVEVPLLPLRCRAAEGQLAPLPRAVEVEREGGLIDLLLIDQLLQEGNAGAGEA
mmetsp:Transcript_123670/g.344989  ORF Transcript_123670/g.344989 Transcript_123670/m.344989 type:complete len:251 (-) Transcript_123670:51-803(-)